jgi:branched-chain amino acid aminotransferase
VIVYLNGKFLPEKDAKISVFDTGFLYGDGIFETLRTYGGKIWQIDEHLARLYESARMRGWKLSWKPAEIAEVIEKTVKKNMSAEGISPKVGRKAGAKSWREFRIRVTITAGAKDPTLFVWVQELERLPKTVYTKGVRAITFPLERPFPQMKTTSMQSLIVARSEMMKKKAFEAFLLNRKGYITEGSWTNVFVVRNKKIITPRIGVLLGTTRGTILKLAKPLFRIRLKNISLRALLKADEVFIANAPKGIVPVVNIDGERIGNGKVGPITKLLIGEFAKKVEHRRDI